MSKSLEMLEIVDANDNVIGLETREKIHKNELLHREIQVYFFTPKVEIIFQHRAKNKDVFPDKLDATVGGHVEPKMSYKETVIKECKEETGIDIDLSKLVFLKKIQKKSFDKAIGLINNIILNQYSYLYDGSIVNLQVEDDKAQGFEVWKIDDLFSLSETDKDRFIPTVPEQAINVFNQTKQLLKK